jgi:hypothetical protein
MEFGRFTFLQITDFTALFVFVVDGDRADKRVRDEQ